MIHQTFSDAVSHARIALKNYGFEVHNEKWQGITSPMNMWEIINYSLQVPIKEISVLELQQQTKCNMPWAEDHFQERVSGKPLNPGNEYKNWPYYVKQKENDRFRTENQKFTHSYMERYWPKFANDRGDTLNVNEGIRYDYGDLQDVIKLLLEQPNTRQAYLPVWFPEDTGAVHGGRVPCSLGYHFLHRMGKFHITYFIRSCDIFRHFQDDIYLTVRLCQWVLSRLQEQDLVWEKVTPGLFTMHIGSLHCFVGERNLLK